MKSQQEELQAMLREFLPPHELIYCEEEEHNILGLCFHTAGVAVRFGSGLEVFASSSERFSSPLLLAGYELLERYVVMTSLPKPREEKSFRFSVSNGVAIHRTFEEARLNSYLELLERNEILRSWYFKTPIRKLDVKLDLYVGPDFVEHYEMGLYNFSNIPGRHVIGLFAFPKNREYNLIYGFGAGLELGSAVNKARKEFITRLGFLWEERPELVEGSDIRNAGYHQEFYLLPENAHFLREWLEEGQLNEGELRGPSLRDIHYADITPDSWRSKFSLVKAQSSDSIPLFFGLPGHEVFEFPYRCDIPHPVV